MGKLKIKTELQNFKIWGDLSLQSQGIFNKTIILLALVGYKIIVANSDCPVGPISHLSSYIHSMLVE